MKQPRWTFALTTVLFGVAVALFFALAYPHHLHFQEQYQLFMFNWNYVCEVLSAPGGVADLAGRFLTQFFLYAWVGASVIALVLMAVQVLAYRCLTDGWTLGSSRLKASSRKKANSGPSPVAFDSPVAYALSFIPSILCVCLLTDENALMTVPVALLLLLLLALLLRSFVRSMGESANSQTQTAGRLRKSICFVLSAATVCAMAYILSTNHYHRTADASPVWAWASVWVMPLLLALKHLIGKLAISNSQQGTSSRKKSCSRQLPIYLVLWLALMTAGGAAVNSLQSQSKEDTMAADFMARNAMWNRIIQRAQKRAPRNQVSVVALNLALSQRGMLAGHIFDFPQNGMAGLLPNYNKDHVSSLATSEVFYRLGLINTAQRFVFESQEAIPDFQKSARCYRRLAETNLINGQYEVARKYLNALCQTLYYRSWAEETLALLSDEAVEGHPVYGELRRKRCHEDYFFGGNSPQQILLKQLEANPGNRMAGEYLKAAMTFDRFR